ncbi:hypothetical protein H5S09_00955 [Limosilactobacillus sp. STM2_1]|uniref:Uncharacterized protein n=1 Tax=Limosilactobacillus rudii TaxID=2759755 RepID=A0A7W3YMR0_9LACO|nr:hypothetical protein [Limosilactobacillus rudii]MBB1078412.1 hypothetical protein [Limosilactobacillus rudii]MBB1096542.1 hypothetical protein [Limosilactobacillus rudii]MCD7134261.1 hypothetical protein [Limosilactobacillus rudii]
MVKSLNEKTLAKTIGGYGNFAFDAIQAVAVKGSTWHHRRDIQNGYYASSFHE